MSPLELIASAIATIKGYYVPKSLPATNNNPGDLRASPLPRKKDAHGFVQFLSPEEGIAALYTQILLWTIRGFTITQLINTWAPPTGADGGNNTSAYLKSVGQLTGLPLDVKIMTMLTCRKLSLPKINET